MTDYARRLEELEFEYEDLREENERLRNELYEVRGNLTITERARADLQARLARVMGAQDEVADLQARLAAAEERCSRLRNKLLRAEAVVEAAKRHVDTSGGSPHGDLDVAVRRYEEGR